MTSSFHACACVNFNSVYFGQKPLLKTQKPEVGNFVSRIAISSRDKGKLFGSRFARARWLSRPEVNDAVKQRNCFCNQTA